MNRAPFTLYPDDVREIRHFHLCGAIGGGAKGFNRGQARIVNLSAVRWLTGDELWLVRHSDAALGEKGEPK